MKKFILGKKVTMSQVFDKKGNVVPVTIVKAGPVVVTQLKTSDRDGYVSVQVGYDDSAKKMNKPLAGHLKDLGKFRYLKEFRVEDVGELQRGTKIDVSTFSEGDNVKITGFSKGRGFQGVMKRHGFRGAPASHGTKHSHRAPGSIGSGFPEHVFKGLRMAGRMGYEQVTQLGLTIVGVDSEKNLLAIKGAVPGARGTLLQIQSED